MAPINRGQGHVPVRRLAQHLGHSQAKVLVHGVSGNRGTGAGGRSDGPWGTGARTVAGTRAGALAFSAQKLSRAALLSGVTILG